MSLGGGGGGGRFLKGEAQGGRDPQGFGPRGARCLGIWPRGGEITGGGGGEITGTSDPLFLSVIYAYAFWRLCLIEANYKETENSNI